ncbi:hypothetical protein K501DRAFT_265162 [Backusella circina FSU 941]|nr:hypothetical protein K501DRAFT_265162 [Backusella circina FSU 941]
MTETGVSYVIKEGELCLAIRNNKAIVVKDQHLHCFHIFILSVTFKTRMCVPNTTLKDLLKVTTKQTILDNTKLNEECKSRILRVIEDRKIDETQYNDGSFVLHHQKTLRYVNSLREALKIKYGKKAEKKPVEKPDPDKELSEDIEKLDIGK